MKCLSVGSVASHSCYRVQWSVAATWKHRISLWNLEEPDQMDWNTIRTLLESVGIEVLCLYLMKLVATWQLSLGEVHKYQFNQQCVER